MLKTILVAAASLLLSSALFVGTVAAQPAPDTPTLKLDARADGVHSIYYGQYRGLA